MEEKILSILRKVLENQDLDTTCSQDNCELWDSLHHLSICFDIEGEFGILLEPEEMTAIKSFDDIERIVAKKKIIKD